jgi:hypothetical protein
MLHQIVRGGAMNSHKVLAASRIATQVTEQPVEHVALLHHVQAANMSADAQRCKRMRCMRLRLRVAHASVQAHTKS